VLGRAEAGARLAAEMRARMAAWRAATEGLPQPRVVCLEWIEPPFALGNWGPELVTLAGGENLLGKNLGSSGHSSAVPWEAVRAARPEVLVVAPCGFDLARTAGEMAALERQPGFGDMRVYIADGNLYFNRSGPSLFDTIDILAEILHPAHFPPRHEGTAWRRWS
jgi:iron complex transport system substrate-binding protein